MKQINIILDQVYKRNKISNNQHITNLKPFFLTNAKKTHLNNYAVIKTIIKLQKKSIKNILEETSVYNFKSNNTENNTTITATTNSTTNNHNFDNYKLHKQCKDTLYWNLYILNYGYLEYINIHHRYGNVMLDDKINMSKFIKNNMSLMKMCNYKMSKAYINEMASSLICENSVNINILYAYVVYYKCNIIVLHHSNKYFISFTNENNSKTHIIKYTEKNTYTIVEENCKNVDSHINGKLQFVNYSKPLNSMSSYKMDDLRKFGEILEIDVNKKKEDLYNSIYAKLLW